MSQIGEELARGARVILEMETAAREQIYDLGELRRGFQDLAKQCWLDPSYRHEVRWMLDARRVQGTKYTERWTDARLIVALLGIGEVPDPDRVGRVDEAAFGELTGGRETDAVERVHFLERQRVLILSRHESLLKELKDIDRELLALGVDPEGGET